MDLKLNIHEKMNIGEQLFYTVGNNGPIILIIINLFLLRKKITFLVFYLIGYGFNILLNQCLKLFFLQPRPSIDSKTFELSLKQMKNVNNYSNLISYDAVLGMPSGHAQGVFYSFAYFCLVFYQKIGFPNKFFFFYLFILVITIIQRVYYQFHTIAQIIVGGFIGISYAYLIFTISNKYKKGILKKRAEENGPI